MFPVDTGKMLQFALCWWHITHITITYFKGIFNLFYKTETMKKEEGNLTQGLRSVPQHMKQTKVSPS